MYVAELDRPWTDTPFMFQGFHLRTEQQLATLKKFCKHVFVDIERTEKWEPPRPAAAPFRIKGTTAYPEKVTVEVEFRQATTDYARTLTSVGELLKPVAKQGGVLDAKDVKDTSDVDTKDEPEPLGTEDTGPSPRVDANKLG